MKTLFDFTSEIGPCQGAFRNARLYEEGFVWKYSLERSVSHDEVIAIVTQMYPDAVVAKLQNETTIRTENFYCFVHSSSAISLYTKEEQEVEKFFRSFPELFIVSSSSFSIRYVSMNKGEPDWDILSFKTDRIETVYPELYPDINVQYLSEDFSNAREKILMLHGLPGVGKTSFIRYFITNFIANKKIVYVKDPAVLNSSKFWLYMTTNSFDYLILDDIGTSLQPREDNHQAPFVSELLSYTSGILEQNSCRIIITTNQTIRQIDPALVRPGRCFDFITLQPLSFTQGKELWVNKFDMDAEVYDTLYGDMTEVTQAAIMSDYERLQHMNKVRRYIRNGDQDYSITAKLRDAGMLDKVDVGF